MTAAHRVATAPRAAGTLRLGRARTGIEVRMFFRERDSMVFTFAFPVILLFIFGSVFGGEIAPGGVSFTQYFAAGMIASGIALSSFQSLAIGIAVERDDGTLKRLKGTPMPPMAYFLGKIGLVLVTSVVQFGVLLVVSRLFFGLKLPGPRRPVAALRLAVPAGDRGGHHARHRLLVAWRGPRAAPRRSSAPS